ncbi:MAG: hypothetical protein KatS3mg104_1260 [Phycisphaerae bacterium]|nr:MAG: hypothetical protein KatS3mg104_1260 [Phycisphaerae bacterium]
MSRETHPDETFLISAIRRATRRHRYQQTAHGIMLFISVGCVASLVAATLSHWLREGTGSVLVLCGWIFVLGASAWTWLIIPLISRYPRERIVRRIEARLPILKNTLTNVIQLSQRPEIRTNPFLPLIYQEARQTIESIPIHRVLSWKEVIPVFWRTCLVILVSGIMIALFWHPLSHGWVQMFNPRGFVPTTSSVRLIEVRPGNITLVKSQSLEVFVRSAGLTADQNVPTRMVVEPRIDGKNILELSPIAPNQFATRIRRVDFPIRYRIEVGETQSPWYHVSVLDRIELTGLSLNIRPPAYTRLPVSSQQVSPSSSLSVTVPDESEIQIKADLDHPVRSAMLHVSDEPPREMQPIGDGTSFIQTIRVDKDMPVSILVTDSSGLIIARLPDSPLMIHVKADTPPRLRVRWPSQDLSVLPNTPLLIRADLQDDLGLGFARIFMSTSAEGPMDLVTEIPLNGRKTYSLVHELSLKPELRKPGTVIRVRIEASDNRDLSPTVSTQNTASPVYNISFRDPQQTHQNIQTRIEQIRSALRQMLIKQQDLYSKTFSDRLLTGIYERQSELRDQMIEVARTQPFAPWEANISKTLLMLATHPAQTAMNLVSTLPNEPSTQAKQRMFQNLQIQQQCILSTLQTLVEILKPESPSDPTSPETTQASYPIGPTIETIIQQQTSVLDQTLSLTRKSVEELSDSDRKQLENLIRVQDQIAAFLQKEISRQSDQVTQGRSNPSVLLSLLETHTEITLATETLRRRELDIARICQQIGLQLARQILAQQTGSPDSSSQSSTQASGSLMTDLPRELDQWIEQITQQQDQLLLNLQEIGSNTDPVGEAIQNRLKQLSEQQERIRSTAERLNTVYSLGLYDRYWLLKAIAVMYRIESDLESGRIPNALLKKNQLLNALWTSRMLIGGEIHLQYNTVPVSDPAIHEPFEQSFGSVLPPAWQDVLQVYYQRLHN